MPMHKHNSIIARMAHIGSAIGIVDLFAILYCSSSYS